MFASGSIVPIDSEPSPFRALYTPNIQDSSTCPVYADSISYARNLGRHQWRPEESQCLCLQPQYFCKLNSTTFKSWLAEFMWEVCKPLGTSREEYLTICAELPPDARPDEVRRFFESVGPIRECRVMKGTFIVFRRIIQIIEWIFSSSQGYGFIEYEAQKVSIWFFFLRRLISGAFDLQDADECVDTFHGRDFQGRPLLVEFAKENRRREPNMDRSYVAVFKAAVGDSPHRELTIVIRLVLQSPSTWNPTSRNWLGERC